MPRKPNYAFERSERNRLKAEKKAERLRAKQVKSDVRQPEAGEVGDDGDADGGRGLHL